MRTWTVDPFEIFLLLLFGIGLGLMIYSVVALIRRGFSLPVRVRSGAGLGCLGLMLVVVTMFCGSAFAPARAKAEDVTCQSNLKQLATTLLIYMQDHDERFPPGGQWCDGIEPFLKDREVFHCPLSERPYSYGFNANLSQRSPLAWPLDASPAETFLLFESCRGVKNAADGGESFGLATARPRYYFFGMQGISLPPAKVESKPGEGPHTGGGNFAYVDGHVKWVRDDHVPPPNTGAWAVGVPAKEKK